MTKFSTFLVFALGAVLIIIVGINTVKHFMPEPPRPGDEAAQLPPSDLPPLAVGTQAVFEVQLDRLFTEGGGVDGVKKFVEEEFKPGRELAVAPSGRMEMERRLGIVDRELRRCDRNGAVMLEQEPVVPRISAKPQVGNKGVLQSWVRPHLEVPLHLTVWCVPLGE